MEDSNAVAPCCPHEWWRLAVGFEDNYEVSSCGRVYSHITARVLNPTWNNTYYLITITGPDGRCTKRIHSLVAEAFYGPKPAGLQVCHNDGDARNNHVANLRYGTPADNGRDKTRHMTHCKRGHELSGENLYEHTDRKGYTRRQCRTCHERAIADWKKKHKARAS